jgi:hypothetical protein
MRMMTTAMWCKQTDNLCTQVLQLLLCMVSNAAKLNSRQLKVQLEQKLALRRTEMPRIVQQTAVLTDMPVGLAGGLAIGAGCLPSV